MKVLFICKGNYVRSQMAEAIYNKMTNSHDATSAGTYPGAVDEPEGQVLSDLFANDSPFMRIMDEHGMNIRNKRTVRLTPKILKDVDIAVSMAEEPFIPDFLKNDKRVIWWDIDNPKEASEDFVRETYQKLTGLINGLIEKQSVLR